MCLHMLKMNLAVTLVYVICLLDIFILEYGCHGLSVDDVYETKVATLQSKLNNSLKQIQTLKRQNSRFKKVASALEQMLDVLQEFISDADDIEEVTAPLPGVSNNDKTLDNSEHKVDDDDITDRFKLVSVSSGGLVDGLTTVSITYTGPYHHFVNWYITGTEGAERKLSGEVDTVKTITTNSALFSSNVTFSNDTRFGRFIIGNTMINVRQMVLLNMSSILVKGTQSVSDIEHTDIVKVSKSYVAPTDNDLEVEVIVQGDVEQTNATLHRTYYSVLTFNTFKNGSNLFLNYDMNNDREQNAIKLNILPRTNTTTTVIITIAGSYAEHGGLLYFFFKTEIGGYITNLYQQYIIKVLSSEKHEVFPYGSIVFRHNRPQTLLVPPYVTFECNAFGNPSPQVVVLKVSADNTTTELEPEVMSSDWYTIASINVYANQPHESVEKYMCRAVSGSKTREVSTEVIHYEPIKFDDTFTGVMVNNTDEIVFSCKVSGMPVPTLRMTSNGKYNQELSSYGDMQVLHEGPNNKTSVATFTLSPPNYDIDTVYCVAEPTIFRYDIRTERRKLELFPGSTPDTNLTSYYDM